MITISDYYKGMDFSNGRIIVGKRKDGWALFDKDYKEIIPPGKYDWIDKFWKGFARVTVLPDISEDEVINQLDLYYDETGKEKPKSYPKTLKECPLDIRKKYAKFGLINERGEEIIPPTYDKIWNFYEKQFDTIVLEDNGQTYLARFTNPTDITPSHLKSKYNDEDTDVDYHYYGEEEWDGEESEFAGTYAHDQAGFSDDEIYDIFDGDPDAYWNID